MLAVGGGIDPAVWGFTEQVSHGGHGAHGGRVAHPRPRAAPWTAEALLRSATTSQRLQRVELNEGSRCGGTACRMSKA